MTAAPYIKWDLKRGIPWRWLILGIIVLSVAVFPRAWAGAPDGSVLVIHPKQQFDFAKARFSAKDYATAITEFQRFIHFFPDDSRVDQARYYTALSRYHSTDYPGAIAIFNRIIDTGKNDPLIPKSYLMIKECYLKQNDVVRAIITLNNMILTAMDDETKDRARYELGWVYLEDARWAAAKSSFEKVSSAGRRLYRLKRLANALTAARDIPRKHPATAGILAIIPGAGYAYCQRPRDALVAFLVNAGLIYTAIEAFDHDNTSLGILLTLVELGFYSGNIHGAINSAHKFNNARTHRFIDGVKKNLKITLSADSGSTGIALSLRYTF